MLQRRRQPGLDAHDLDAALVPGGDAADQPAAADGDQQRVDLGRLPLQLEADAALPQHGLDLVEGVHRERAGLRDIRFAGGQGLGVDLAADRQLRAVAADARDLGRRGDLGDEDAGLVAQAHGRVGHGRAVIAAGCGRDPGGGTLRVSRLAKAPRALKEPECCVSSSFSVQRAAGEAEVLAPPPRGRAFAGCAA